MNINIGLDYSNFLDSDYEIHEDELNGYLKTVDAQIEQVLKVTQESLNNKFEKVREHVNSNVKQAQQCVPDFSQLFANYNAHFTAIREELEKDPSLKHISDVYNEIFAKLETFISEISKILEKTTNSLQKTFELLQKQFGEIFNESFIPFLKELQASAIKIVEEARTKHLKYINDGLKYISAVLKEHGPTIKKYAKSISDLLKPFNENLVEIQKFLAQIIEDLIGQIKAQINNLPSIEKFIDGLKLQLEQMKLPEKILELVNGIFDQLHILPQTPESSELLKKLHEYIVAKLTKQSVQDEKVLDNLLKLFVKAIRSFAVLLNIETSNISHKFSNTLITAPVLEDLFNVIPAALTFRFSMFNLLVNENWSGIFSMEYIKSWIFFRNFELRGHVLDGRHILSFDGIHFDFPGTCKYVLVQDSVDNNFTVISQLNNGKLKSITLTDKDGNYVEVNDIGALKYNGKQSEYPKHENGLHAWRRYYTVWLRSEYGVEVVCTTDLKICHVEVNGFYTSKTRGLLGNGNAEPYDDYLQIDGTIAGDVSSFANGFGIGKCASAKATDDNSGSNRAEICSEFFGRHSTLAVGYIFLDPRPYRAACDGLVLGGPEKDIESIACNVALSYASSLRLQNQFALIPLQCAKCSGAVGQRELGQEFTVKIPNNKADIVFVVDMGMSDNVIKKLVAPAISDIRDTLKTRGFTDTHVGIIAYKESQRYPAILTSDNGKLNYQGNLATVKLEGPGHFCENCISQLITEERAKHDLEFVENAIEGVAIHTDEKAIELALEYPFRAGAAKSIVVVRNNTIDYNNIFKTLRAHFTSTTTQFDSALLHLIAPLEDLNLEGIPAEKIVGFNTRVVATLDKKEKKRPKLQFKNGLAIDFVLKNGGWVFNTNNFEKLDPQEQKKALSQITNSISDTLFKTEIVSDCMCTLKHGLHPQHKCVIKSSNFVPNKKPKAAETK